MHAKAKKRPGAVFTESWDSLATQHTKRPVVPGQPTEARLDIPWFLPAPYKLVDCMQGSHELLGSVKAEARIAYILSGNVLIWSVQEDSKPVTERATARDSI